MMSESEVESSGGAGAAGASSAASGANGARGARRATVLPGNAAFRFLGAWLRFLIPALLGLAFDLAVKSNAFPAGVPAEAVIADPLMRSPAGRHPELPPLEVIPHVLAFQTTVNAGAVFGWAQGKVPVFLAFSVVALGVIVWVFVTSLRHQWMVHFALGLITAGALGNLYDRAVFHGVRDMFRFYVSWYPFIFNIADVLLCVGVPLLIMRWLFVKEAGAGK